MKNHNKNKKHNLIKEGSFVRWKDSYRIIDVMIITKIYNQEYYYRYVYDLFGNLTNDDENYSRCDTSLFSLLNDCPEYLRKK